MQKRLLGVVGALGTVIFSGIVGYMAIEGWSFFDSLYMTVITIASVGYMEVHDLSHQGRAFTIVLILCGSAALIYGLSTLTAFIVEGDLTQALRRRKMSNAIARLTNHYIVCGLSATGRHIVEELAKTGRGFVVIDKDAEKLRPLADAGILHIQGDATHEAVITGAGIAQAAGLFTAMHHDADNLLAVVTARGLRPDLTIVSKAIDAEAERKLRQVGATRVVMPNAIGGLRMASEMIRPSVVTFLDTMLRASNAVIRVEEIQVRPESPLAGKSLDDSGLLALKDVTVVAVVDTHGGYRFNPPREQILHTGDVVIVMGMVEQIRAAVTTPPSRS